jgi:hypothetical protein
MNVPVVRKGQTGVALTREEFARRLRQRFDDPDFDLPVEWLEARDRIQSAAREQKQGVAPSRILLVCGAARTDQSCPGEMSKTFPIRGRSTRPLHQRRIVLVTR